MSRGQNLSPGLIEQNQHQILKWRRLPKTKALLIEVNVVFVRCQLHILINTNIEVKLTSLREQTTYSQNIINPINFEEGNNIEIA